MLNRVLGIWAVVATLFVLAAGGGAFEGDDHLDEVARKQTEVNIPGAPAETSGEAGSAETASVGDTESGETAPAGEAVGSGAEDESLGDETTAAPEEGTPRPSKIKHVFLIALAGHGFDATFGPGSAASYLNGELRPKGALLEGYNSLGPADLPDYIAMIGGQPPNSDTRAGCPVFKEIGPVSPSKSGEITADGCVYPNTVTTVADQLTATQRSWRAYVEDIGSGPRGAVTCRRPESNGADDTLKARPGDGYATRHNPFVYFHSLLDLSDCDQNDGPLDRLEQDLAATKSTPNLSFIAPNLCNDGTESPCADGSAGGLAAADAFLARWVPKVLASPAYKEDGLLIVTFAGSAGTPPGSAPDESVRNGTLLVSPFADAGSTIATEYDPYSLLRSVQDLFGLSPLARTTQASSFAQTALAQALNSPLSDG